MRPWQRRLAVLALGLLAFVLIGPYIIPMPAQPERDPAEFAPEAGRFVTVSGVRTFIQEDGPQDGPAVILVHGFGGSTYTWRHTLPTLAAAGYRVLALDLKGYGLADKGFEQSYTHPSQADFVAEVMTAVGVERGTLVGHSMGGSIIAHFAQRHPGRVERLVFVDGALREAGSPDGGSILGLPVQLGALADFAPFQRWGQLLLRSFLARQRMGEVFRSAYYQKSVATPEVEEGYLQVLKMKGWDLALLGVLRDSGASALEQPLATLTAPTDIIWGANDPWIPLERGQALQAAIAGSRLSVVPETGHLPMEEAPAIFNRLLLEGLSASP